MMPLPELTELDRKRREIQDQLAALGDLRPGSLTPRYRKCGKPTCHCAAQGDPGHGPSWSLTWTVEGKTRTRIVPVEAVEETQAQIAEYRRARALARELFEVSARMCDVQLQTVKAAQKKSCVEAVETDVRREIAAEAASLIGEGVMDDFQAIEIEARRVALRIMGQAVARKLNADRSDEESPHLPCECGAEARFAGRRAKTFTTALGPLTLERAWYHCDGCRHGFSPRDHALGMEDTFLSPAALRMIGAVAARTSFKGASTLLRELADLAVAPKTVERHAEALGREIASDECRVIEPEPRDAPTLYLGLDGTGVPARKTEVEGRAGKQPDGSAKTREAKLAVVWSAETKDKDARPLRDPGSATYNAAIESIATRDTDIGPAPFAQRILRETERRGFDKAPRQVVLGDGASWIWNFADEHCPDAIRIVDIFHAKGHLFEVAKAIYGIGSEIGERWAGKRREELDEGRVDEVIAALRSHAETCDEARKNVEYFSNNRERMNYPKFRAMGLCVATGVVEGGCKNIVGARLKQAGMRWTVAGANAIIALRCAVESNRFDDFWERRAGARS